mmetsp:Transcript_361/g.900  ORF Transcript_361/g.900 Transcript_361/m.900 type:complete len:502 (+) Transcript_361:271-1776(+)
MSLSITGNRTLLTSKSATTVGLAAAAAVAAATLLFLTLSNEGEGEGKSNKLKKKALPRTKMGILETIRMMAGATVPFDLLDIAHDLGSYVFELNLPIPGHPKTVVVADPEDVRSILKDPMTDKPRALYGRLAEMVPSKEPSLFAMQSSGIEGQEWHRRRKGAMPAFSPRHVRRMNEVAYEHATLWCDGKLASFASQDLPFDVVDEMMRLILRAFCDTALEYHISDQDMDMFLEEWHLASKEYFLKSTTNPFRKYFQMFLPDRRRAQEAVLNILGLLQRIIDNYRSLDEPVEGTVINRIMTNPTFKDDHQLKSELFAFIVAGSDTTAISLSWILSELAKNPDEQKRLRDALQPLERDEWSSNDVLRKVVNEGLRIHPVGAANLARQIGRDYVTARDSYYLPKGTVAFLPIYLVHRNHHTFDDPDLFRPSRWDNPTEKVKNGLMPFAAGKQNCVGQSLANAELHCILAQVIKDYEFSIHQEGSGEHDLVLKPVGLRMKVKRIL